MFIQRIPRKMKVSKSIVFGMIALKYCLSICMFLTLFVGCIDSKPNLAHPNEKTIEPPIERLISRPTPHHFSNSSPFEIDQKCSDCCALNSSNPEMKTCTLQGIKDWESEMNKYFNLLRDTLEFDNKKRLIVVQDAWVKFAQKELEFNINLYSKLDGTIWGLLALGETMEKFKTRALQLKAHYDSLTGEILKG